MFSQKGNVMDRGERVQQLMQEAENLGLHLEFDSGLVLVKRPQSDDRDRQEAIFAKLARYLPDVRCLVELRASGVRAKEFIGARIWCADGAGSLVGSCEDGSLTIRVGAEMRRSDEDEAHRSQMSISANAESLLIIVDEEGADVAASRSEGPTSEQPKPGFFQRLRHG
jgi:hypothetical protein